MKQRLFACLGRGERSAIVDFRLFLPESWANDATRCEMAGIPEPDRVHRSKQEQALEMLKSARERGLQFRWILADAAYGSSQEFAREVAALDYLFMLDAAGSTCVWNADPEPIPQVRAGGTGRPSGQCHPGNSKAKRSTLEKLVKERFAREARELTIRQTTQGPLRAKVL